VDVRLGDDVDIEGGCSDCGVTSVVGDSSFEDRELYSRMLRWNQHYSRY
jgi:hypothetical protein